jgi:hypothetical protein
MHILSWAEMMLGLGLLLLLVILGDLESLLGALGGKARLSSEQENLGYQESLK